MIDVPCMGNEKIGLGLTKVKPPFNHNYSIMPNINTSVHDLLLKSDRRFDFTVGSNKPMHLTADPVVTYLDDSNSSKVCAESVSVSGSKLNPNSEPYVLNGSLEQAFTSSISGRPCHIARHFLHRPTEFFYGKNQKVKPKAKPVTKPMRTEQSCKPRVKP
ncbi:hypothetical protein R6Q57_015959 [Mikania cordata]